MATQKQANYALALMSQLGIGTNYWRSQDLANLVDLGLSLSQREAKAGTAEAILLALPGARVSALIDTMKQQLNP